MSGSQWRVREVAVGTVRPLRHEILRPGRPPETGVLPGDADPRAVHLAAFRADDPDSRVIGVASAYPEDPPGDRSTRPGPAWRLRGMATSEDARGAGVGRALLEAAVAAVAGRGGRLLWCTARTSAAGFYGRAGFQGDGAVFELPGVGPHLLMVRVLPPPTGT